jgi:DNA repair ATPase RecN
LLNTIRVKNFQSLQDINLELGRFTVIVGPSSSGKSAITRAIKAVASNSLDSDNITQGTKHSAISVTTDLGTVTIERNSGDSSAYKVTKVGSKESSYSKLNRQVPAEITEILGITPSTKDVESINFAGQHDAPYLLKDSSSNVARILGELTNVSTIFAAVKEASRRAKAASTMLNVRKKDLALVVTQISKYSAISVHAATITQAEIALVQATETDRKFTRLQTVLSTAEKASDALEAIKEIPTMPDLGQLVETQAKLTRFLGLIQKLTVSAKNTTDSQASIQAADSAIIQIEAELHEHLEELGYCPLCNQTTRKATADEI